MSMETGDETYVDTETMGPPPETSEEYDSASEHFLRLESEVVPDSVTVASSPDWDLTPPHSGTVEWADSIPTANLPPDVLYRCAEHEYDRRKRNADDDEAVVPVYAPASKEQVPADRDTELVRYAGEDGIRKPEDGDNILTCLADTSLQMDVRIDDDVVPIFAEIPSDADYAGSKLAKAIRAAGGEEWEISALNNSVIPIKRNTDGQYEFDPDSSWFFRWKLERRHYKWALGHGYQPKPYLDKAENLALVPAVAVGGGLAWVAKYLLTLYSLIPITFTTGSGNPEAVSVIMGLLLYSAAVLFLARFIWRKSTKFLVESVMEERGRVLLDEDKSASER